MLNSISDARKHAQPTNRDQQARTQLLTLHFEVL